MSKLTERARNQPCTIRLAGCDGGGDTTVLAHYRLQALGAGMGRKPHDIFGAYACVRCHDAVDGRRTIPECDRTEVRLAHLEGVLKTIHLLMVAGKLKL
ncbi:MAG TPA: nuclease domain-containing protein [Bryobacteraceae bacterium]|nr:nuclease domain-containing protein [Bryobacteraceae bacterium]